MPGNSFSSESFSEAWEIVKSQFLLAVGETLYVTLLSTLFAVILGFPLGILLVAGGKSGIIRVPKAVLVTVDALINILRSIPFLILMILVIPLTRLIVGTSVGTLASVVPLTVAAFPMVARLTESSLRELDPNLIEMAKSSGASPFMIIVKVMIPECVPSLIANTAIALTTILGYTAMSGILGGGGLGKIAVNYGYYRYKYPVMLFAVILLIIMVQIFQSVGNRLALKLDRRNKNKSEKLN